MIDKINKILYNYNRGIKIDIFFNLCPFFKGALNMEKEKKEFGKILTGLLVAFLLINFEIIIILAFILIFKFGDLSPLNELLIGTFAVIGTITTGAVGFYQWKTKAINIIKIKQSLGMKIKEKDLKDNDEE